MSFADSNRGLARNYLGGFLTQGYSANQTLRTLQDLGVGYRRTDFLADWREVAGKEAQKDVYKYLRKDLKPSVTSLVSTSESLSGEYAYFFKVKGIDRMTGESVEKDWRVSTDSLITREEAESDVEQLQEYITENTGIDYQSVTLTNVTKRLYL